MRNLVFFALFGLVLATSGCSGAQVSGEDVLWPSDTEMAAKRMKLPQNWERAPFLMPIEDLTQPPFHPNTDTGIDSYNRFGVPQFSFKDHRGLLLWYLTHKNRDTGKPDLDEIQVYSYPENAVDRMRRGPLSADDFAWGVYLKGDKCWLQLNADEIAKRHDRWHWPRLASTPGISRLASTEPSYVHALPVVHQDSNEPQAVSQNTPPSR